MSIDPSENLLHNMQLNNDIRVLLDPESPVYFLATSTLAVNHWTVSAKASDKGVNSK